MTTTTSSTSSSSAFSSLGTGSGLDLTTLLSNLVAAERAPQQTLITQKQTSVSTTVSALGTLKSASSSLQDALSALKDAKAFSNRTATSGDTSVFSVAADSTADISNYTIGVLNLAAANKIASGNFATPSTVVGTGKLTVSVGGNAFDVTIDNTNNTLAGIRDAINGAAGNTSVKASILTVSDGNGGTVSKLTLAANITGANSQIAISTVDSDGNNTDGAGLSQLYYSKSDVTSYPANTHFTEVNAAKDAVITIDGFQATSSTNVFSSAIPGVTITALKGDPQNPPSASLSVAADKNSVKTAIQKFVSAYNSYAFTYNQLTSYDQTTGTAGPLLGNGSVSLLSGRIRQGLTNAVSGAPSDFNSLTNIGITTNSDGSLSINDTKLSAALSNRFTDVATLFSGTQGVAGRLYSQLNDALSTTGLFQNTQNTLQKQLDNLTKQQSALDTRMAALETTYRTQFSALDTIVAQLKQTGNFLTQQFAKTTSTS